jgi:DNA-binding beta-propeller fold protein YncE
VNAILKIFIVLMAALPGRVLAQTDSAFTLARTYEGDIADAAIDQLDNLYIISSTGQIKKFGPNGDSTGVYNQVKKFGTLYSIDVSNPLKVILFYKDFSTIVVLDRFLASINTISLRIHGILQPGAVGISYDNNLWVFDEYDNKLKKIDDQGNHIFETADFRTIFNSSLSPQRVLNDNGLVYLADSVKGVYIFDNYGAFKKKIPVLHWRSLAVSQNRIISLDGETITVYNTGNMLQTQRKAPFFQPYLHSFTTANRLLTFSSDRLRIYQFRF